MWYRLQISINDASGTILNFEITTQSKKSFKDTLGSLVLFTGAHLSASLKSLSSSESTMWSTLKEIGWRRENTTLDEGAFNTLET